MATAHYRHIFLAGPNQTHGFTSPGSRGRVPRIPERNREQHSTRLLSRLQQTWDESDDRAAVAHVDRNGAYIDFESDPGSDLITKSLENMQAGIRLLNIRTEGSEDSERTLATVYVPNDQRNRFLRKLHAYAHEETAGGQPRNARMVNSIGDIHRSVLESFWRADERSMIPNGEPAWVEVWLRGGGSEVAPRFRAAFSGHDLEIMDGELCFPERTVLLIRANRQQLEDIILASDDIAQFRFAKEVASFFVELENREQMEWVQGLLDRTSYRADADVAVCILDHGVNNGHLLIEPLLDNADLHAVIPQWGTHDQNGHGTLMAGTAAYGDLLEILNSDEPVQVSYRLESAKILPPPPAQNPQDLWGLRTAQGISLAEIQAPERKRISCMAITSTDSRDRGRPSSWSAKIDELASGYEEDAKRLVVISAGNVNESDHWRNYPDDNITNEVHDPGQSWNALTVGAYTEKVRIMDQTLANYSPLAQCGELSPFSTTSVDWPGNKWPIKPEVVFEGGNVASGPNGSVFPADDLSLLSTSHEPHVAQFEAFRATSAASALAARTAAQIQVQYPEAWPETIRALMVHTAEWPDALKSQFLPPNPNKGDYARLLRICGYGVPNLQRALFCASNSLTMISQARLQPYDYLNSEARTGRAISKDMHMYSLPWPVDALHDLGETMVRMRVTLSYFIEPGPGEVGWQDRYRYPSHLLRFALNGASESMEEFVQRINRQAREEDEHPGTQSPSDKWLLGQSRDVGSIHSDIWQGTAEELAASNLIAIYPAIGWWRERRHLGRVASECQYSLAVSIETPTEEVDIYTPVANQVGIPIEVAV